jgi:hypothetical protein
MLLQHSPHHVHMPFLFHRDGQLQGVFSESVRRFRRRGGAIVPHRSAAWKLQWIMPLVPASGLIHTGLSEDEDECSPTVCQADGGIQLSFIGTLLDERPAVKTLDGASHRLIVMKGADIDSLGPATRFSDDECYCGFARPDVAILASGVDGTARIVGRRSKTLKTSFSQLGRISYCFDAPSTILITGIVRRGRPPETILYDLEKDVVLGELRINGRPSYKPSLISGLAIAPVPPVGKQGWQLSYGDPHEIAPTDVEAWAS